MDTQTPLHARTEIGKLYADNAEDADSILAYCQFKAESCMSYKNVGVCIDFVEKYALEPEVRTYDEIRTSAERGDPADMIEAGIR